MAEGGQPVAISRELETLGQSPVHASFSRGVTAHPKIDPVTQEMMVFRSDWKKPWLQYGVIAPDGTESLDVEISVPAPAMMHDMAITESHSILLDLNVGFDFSMLQKGFRIPICWQDARQSRLCVIPRHGGKVAWFDIEPCFIQHVVNAYDTPSGKIVFDVARYPHYFRLCPDGRSFLPNPLAVLWRYTIDMSSNTVAEQQLGDLNIELPRLNDAKMGRPYRYLYAVEQPTAEEMRGIVRYDQNSEPIFVQKQNASHEDDGWLLVCVYKHITHTTEIRVLSAENVSAPPVATVSLDRRIPAGFHGAWVPA